MWRINTILPGIGGQQIINATKQLLSTLKMVLGSLSYVYRTVTVISPLDEFNSSTIKMSQIPVSHGLSQLVIRINSFHMCNWGQHLKSTGKIMSQTLKPLNSTMPQCHTRMKRSKLKWVGHVYAFITTVCFYVGRAGKE